MTLSNKHLVPDKSSRKEHHQSQKAFVHDSAKPEPVSSFLI